MTLDALICLGAGPSQVPLILSAKTLGLSVIAIDRDPDAIAFKFADEKIFKSTYDSKGVIEELQIIQAKYNFAGIVARVSGPALYTAAEISEMINLPGLTKDIIPLATEKSELRKFCKKHNFNMPNGLSIGREQKFEINLNYPIIIKPDYPLIGKKDITVVYRPVDLSKFIYSACDSSSNGFAEIEEYIEGIDTSVLFRMANGNVEILTFWDELIGVNKYSQICGLGVGIPSVIFNTETRAKVETFILEFADKLNKNLNTLLILSLRINTKGDIFIIELHADLGGDLIADILLPTSNPEFDFFRLVISNALNIKTNECFTKFSPITLLYSNILYRTVMNKTIFSNSDYLLINEGTEMDNLNTANHFFNTLELQSKPTHFEWISQIRDTK